MILNFKCKFIQYMESFMVKYKKWKKKRNAAEIKQNMNRYCSSEVNRILLLLATLLLNSGKNSGIILYKNQLIIMEILMPTDADH